jgi:NAD(P)-dependent dehydrogenase (short-subunit alcohol dehydrogenase family)
VTGRTVLVTGASKGIGAEIVASLGRAGAHVAAHYGSDRAGAEAATAEIPDDRKLLVGADLFDPAAATRLWETTTAWRPVDVLVNNAAVMEEVPFDASLAEWHEGWERAYRINVLATADLTRAAVEHFAGRGGGVIVTMSSWVAERGSGSTSYAAYAASKAAVKALTQTVARHYGSSGVLAYALAPGVVRTQLSERAAELFGGEEVVLSGLAMGEMVPPSDLAELVLFLAAGRARHLTGATLDVNGATYVR